MRVFTRGLHEGLAIGENVEVTVLEIADDHVRLGIANNEQPSYWEEVVYVEPAEDRFQLQAH